MEGPDNPASSSTAENCAPEPKRGRNNSRRNNQRTQDANTPPQPHPRGDRGRRPPKNSRPPPRVDDVDSGPSAQNSPSWRAQPTDSVPKRGRGAKFNNELTSGDGSSSAPSQARPKFKVAPADLTDLTSILTAALSRPPYPDCAICFSAIHPAQPTWSCSPSTPVLEIQQYCWTTFHLKCIRSWAGKSFKEVADAWAARGEPHRGGEWRCPGCQARRTVVPSTYRCFCGSTPAPSPARISTPHSCASPCTRVRASCAHPCPLLCHPGPCPPCRITTDVKCGCLKATVLALRCGETEVSCGALCSRPLACDVHICALKCHTDACGPCAVREQARCWCGKEEHEVGCGEGEAISCSRDDAPETWIGRFACAGNCDRLFACGTHRCKLPCHPSSGPATECPRSPARVRTCPCGRRPIKPSDSPDAFPARLNCDARIPTCSSPCGQILPCGHACSMRCHEGDCPPCSERVIRPCRCGGSTQRILCSIAGGEDGDAGEILCQKACTALRACGRHRCLRVCCPLASVAALQQQKGKKKRAMEAEAVGVGEERGGLHECDLVCGKLLSCGEHRCEEKDHKGACGRCLRSNFEEVVCPCGRTVLEPPIPCGTHIQCTYQCPRPPPSCGHSRTQHTCHDDEVGCPPCPFLTTKMCMCGKKEIGNVRCAQERVACGNVCGRLLGCGYHHCEKLCHPPDEGCGTCTSACGKPRKLCLPLLHPCTQPCHAPSTCDEAAPCTAVITVVCPCGRIRQPVQCGKSVANPGRENQQPKCSNECLVAKRNARLADALGITQESRSAAAAVVWAEEVLSFARAGNAKFVAVVEKAFADFVSGEKKTQVLPHMPPERRKFVHDVATVYRMDTQMVDQEPHRSVQLIRRFDTRIPTPLLSAVLASSAPPSLGKLGDLRNGSATNASWRPAAPAKPVPVTASTQRAWGSTRAQTSTPTASISQPTPSGRLFPVNATTAALNPIPAAPVTPATPGDVPEDWEDDA
ncbi:hypothetical protein C8J57DRAFT_1161770 [Mycena rebaudengoi]|nr:hypothetical protein C8J57DRAFT_1161770 [Mycena rebaudengoi]